MQDERAHILPDYLREGLKVVFVGTAVGDASAARQHYYSGANNVFWSIVYETAIVSARLGPEDDARITNFGVGLSDIVKDVHTSSDALLSPETLKSGVASFVEKIIRFAPRVVCFNGKNAYNAFAGRKANSFGLTTDKIGTSLVFVVPSTSGRVRESQEFDGKTRWKWFETLAELATTSPAASVEGRTLEAKERTTVKATRDKQERLTLHEEIEAILRANGNRWMSTKELADEVNRRGRYSKRDGSPVTPYQVHGRTRGRYSDRFERDGSRVRLRSSWYLRGAHD